MLREASITLWASHEIENGSNHAGSTSKVCSDFVTQITFWCGDANLVKDSVAIEGDEWIPRTARAAAVPDTLPSQWTLVVGPKVSHLSD
jgi:hypothetical protein